MPESRLLTRCEVERVCGIGRSTIYRLMRSDAAAFRSQSA